MKNLFKTLFAEKILGFKEGANALAELLMNISFVRDKMGDNIFFNEKAGIRTAFGVIAQIGKIVLEFIRKLIYFGLFIYAPYIILAKLCPNIHNNQELTIIYLFTVLSTFCGSIANNTLFTMNDRDFLMMRVMYISPYMNFVGKLVYKMVSELIYFTIILSIFGVGFVHSMLLSIATIALRPVGELIGIICYDYIKKVHNSRGTINGLIMAAAVIIAYTVPYSNRKIAQGWYIVVNPLFTLGMIVIGAGAMYYLWYYKRYKVIMSEAMHIKREA